MKKNNLVNLLSRLIVKLVLLVLSLYQRTLSPDHGWGRIFFSSAGCRFYPSCSEYAKQSLIKYGLGLGLWLALKRLSRCHPLTTGGYDPVS